MLIKKKIAFLFDKKNPWLLHYLPLLKKLPKKKYKYSFFKDYVKISDFEIVFVLGFTKILSESFSKFKLKFLVEIKLRKDDLTASSSVFLVISPVEGLAVNNKFKSAKLLEFLLIAIVVIF